jgi:hypothetical protein
MKTQVEVRLPGENAWVSALLTDERSFGHPVVVMEGERCSRSPLEVFLIRPIDGSDDMLVEQARQAGYAIARHN